MRKPQSTSDCNQVLAKSRPRHPAGIGHNEELFFFYLERIGAEIAVAMCRKAFLSSSPF
jgi:hypothetical protein